MVRLFGLAGTSHLAKSMDKYYLVDGLSKSVKSNMIITIKSVMLLKNLSQGNLGEVFFN